MTPPSDSHLSTLLVGADQEIQGKFIDALMQISVTFDTQRLLNLIVNKTAELVGGERVSVWLVEGKDPHKLVREADNVPHRSSLKSDYYTDHLDADQHYDGLTGWVFATGQSLRLADMRCVNDPATRKKTLVCLCEEGKREVEKLWWADKFAGLRSSADTQRPYLGVPILSHRPPHKTIGVIRIGTSRNGATFTELHERLLEVFARHVSLAIEKTNQVRELVRLIGVAGREEPQEILDELAAKISMLVEGSGCSIFLDSNDESVYYLRATTAPSLAKRIGSLAYRPGEGKTGKVIADGNPLLVVNGGFPLQCSKDAEDCETGAKPAYSFIAAPIKDSDGQVIGVIRVPRNDEQGSFSLDDLDMLVAFATALSDVLERSRLVQELRVSQGQVARTASMAAVGNFLRGLAHEVRSAMIVTAGTPELLLSFQDMPKLAHRLLESMQIRLQSTFRLADRLLDFAREDRGGFVSVDVNVLLGEMIGIMDARLKRHGISVDLLLDPDLPLLIADRSQLLWVFSELTNNAIEAMQSSGGSITITTRRVAPRFGRPDGLNVASIKFTDTGPGIPPDRLGKLWMPPIREGNTPHRGFGLSIANSYVERNHGGRIHVMSTEGVGTSFVVVLPIKEPIRLHILLVDDDPQVLALYEVALQHAGYDVTTATNGADAIALVAMTHFDLVILDVAMPQKDGIQVLREMKQLKPACAAIMITAVFPYDEVRREQALNLGAFAYLMKPQTVAEFVAIVEKYVAHIDLAI